MARPNDAAAAKVKDLCRRLKPIIGESAEKAWMAFLVEDETGKEHIQSYLELLAAQHLNARLDADDPGLIPPKAEDANGEFRLGNVLYNGKELFPFGLREGEWTQHCGIFGRSGAGKTNMGFLVVQQLVGHGKPVLIFDWKRNYRDLLKLPGFENMAVYTVGRSVTPLSFNPLVPPANTSPKTWLQKLVAVVAHAYLLGDGVIYLMQEALDQVYEEAGVYSGRVERWPTFRDVLKVLKKRPAMGRESGWMSSALRAMASLCFGEMDVTLNEGQGDLRSLLDKPAILELDGLGQTDKVFCSSIILLYLHHARMSEPVREEFKHAIVIEEAHHLLAQERHSLVGGQSVMELTFREIREFGESIILLDQHPSTISLPALGNLYCKICFNLTSARDVGAIGQTMLLGDEDKDVIANLQLGQAVVRLQGRSVKPFLLGVPEFEIQKGAMTDADVIHHMSRLGLLPVRQQAVQKAVPGMEAAPSIGDGIGEASSGAPTMEAVFMEDVVKYPESGIVERYKRLGFKSVRQGEKVKNWLVERGLVREEVRYTSRGRVRALSLSDKGRGALNSRPRPPGYSGVTVETTPPPQPP